MQHDEAHALENALLHAVDQYFRVIVGGDVTPPAEDICLLEDGVGQPLFRITECRARDLEVMPLESGRNGAVDPFGVDGATSLSRFSCRPSFHMVTLTVMEFPHQG